MPHILTKSPRLSNQEGTFRHPSTITSKDRGFPPSVFSPGIQEDFTELTADFSRQGRETACSFDLTTSLEDDLYFSRYEEEQQSLAEIVRCPFDGCNFSHTVDRTQATLECEDSWKPHILKVHWPEGGWQVCQLDQCGLTQSSRSSAWKHIAVHVSEFRVDCPFESCTASFSRGDRVAQHIREKHGDKGNSRKL